MKFRVERDVLADAVAWTAKSLPSRPSVPVLAGVLLRVSDGVLQVSGFDYEVSSQVTVDVQADADGAALVSGRLLAEITKALPGKTVDAKTFADAVAQVAVAAGRDDTLPILTGVRMEIEGSTLALLATDRYRLAGRGIEWRPDDPHLSVAALGPA